MDNSKYLKTVIIDKLIENRLSNTTYLKPIDMLKTVLIILVVIIIFIIYFVYNL